MNTAALTITRSAVDLEAGSSLDPGPSPSPTQPGAGGQQEEEEEERFPLLEGSRESRASSGTARALRRQCR